MGNGQWSMQAPCCARPCPPYAPFDLVFMMNRFHPKARRMIQEDFWWSFRRLWSVDPEYYRRAKIIYSSIVHPTTIINLTDPWIGNGARRRLEPNDGITNTGNALRFVRDHVFVKEHRDVIHMDAILLVLDENSDDDVKEAAQALRDDGVLIYTMFMNFNNSPNMQQLLDITGEKEHIFISDGQNEGIGDKIAKEMIGHMCANVCGLGDHSHDK
uniref:Sushi, von Willebrand factor type A, EGF and pentraxin domain-containing protein 1 n=1 Tax=Phallusia mammillata TaxID=59560 RepID=A0A6F9DUB8_9ASCI|nr:sushi, von Willebrand factor type A, EGF and pentraxin domain-containing protein 1 [Phallusia mammillata]